MKGPACGRRTRMPWPKASPFRTVSIMDVNTGRAALGRSPQYKPIGTGACSEFHQNLQRAGRSVSSPGLGSRCYMAASQDFGWKQLCKALRWDMLLCYCRGRKES